MPELPVSRVKTSDSDPNVPVADCKRKGASCELTGLKLCAQILRSSTVSAFPRSLVVHGHLTLCFSMARMSKYRDVICTRVYTEMFLVSGIVGSTAVYLMRATRCIVPPLEDNGPIVVCQGMR